MQYVQYALNLSSITTAIFPLYMITYSRRKRTTQPQNPHPRKRTNKAQAPRIRQIQTLPQQLQAHHRHNPRRNSKHTSIDSIHAIVSAVLPTPALDLKPQRRDTSTKGLTDTTQDGRDEHGFPAGADGEVEGQSKSEAFGDVVDEEGEEDGEAEGGVGVVGGVGDEAFGDLVQGDCRACLKAKREECVRWDVVVVLLGFLVVFFVAVAMVMVVVSVR